MPTPKRQRASPSGTIGLTSIPWPSKRKYNGPSNPFVIGQKLTTSDGVRQLIRQGARGPILKQYKQERASELTRLKKLTEGMPPLKSNKK
jgi:hypothetical protein